MMKTIVFSDFLGGKRVKLFFAQAADLRAVPAFLHIHETKVCTSP